MEIVVSRFNEDLNWTLEEPFVNYKYIVYNKGGNENFEKKNVIKIVNIENVGRECHTYLYHIIHNYDNLSSITLFIPGSVEIWYKKQKFIKTLERIKETNDAVFLAEYTENAYKLFENFEIDFWIGTNTQNQIKNTNGYLQLSEFRPFNKWYEHFFNKSDIIHWWSYHSIFSLDKKDILQHPIERYEKLIKGLEKGDNLEEIHYIERVWAAIFYPFNFTQTEYYEQ